MVVAGVAPRVAHALEDIRHAVAVRVAQARQLALLHHVNRAVHHAHAARLVQAAREPPPLRGLRVAGHALDDEDFALKRRDGEVAVRQEVHAGDGELDALRHGEMLDGVELIAAGSVGEVRVGEEDGRGVGEARWSRQRLDWTGELFRERARGVQVRDHGGGDFKRLRLLVRRNADA